MLPENVVKSTHSSVLAQSFACEQNLNLFEIERTTSLSGRSAGSVQPAQDSSIRNK